MDQIRLSLLPAIVAAAPDAFHSFANSKEHQPIPYLFFSPKSGRLVFPSNRTPPYLNEPDLRFMDVLTGHYDELSVKDIAFGQHDNVIPFSMAANHYREIKALYHRQSEVTIGGVHLCLDPFFAFIDIYSVVVRDAFNVPDRIGKSSCDRILLVVTLELNIPNAVNPTLSVKDTREYFVTKSQFTNENVAPIDDIKKQWNRRMERSPNPYIVIKDIKRYDAVSETSTTFTLRE